MKTEAATNKAASPPANVTDPIRLRAREHPEAQAVIRPTGDAVTYQELERTIDQLAVAVRNLGVQPGAIVAIKTARGYRDLCVRLALARLGIGIAAPSMPAEQVALCLADSGIRDQSGIKVESLDRLWADHVSPEKSVPEVASHQDPKAVCMFCPTSGTTGKPKYAALTHELIVRRLAAPHLAEGLSGPLREICSIGPATIYGLYRRLLVLWGGGTIVMSRNAAQTLQAFDQYQVNHLVTAPSTLQNLVRQLPAAFPVPRSLQQIETGGDALPEGVLSAARDRLCANIVSIYGTTEAGYVATSPAETLRAHPEAAGYAYQGVEIEVVDEQGEPLPRGAAGVLRMRSPFCVEGYFNNPEASALAFRDGWFYPGDQGMVAPDGLLTLVGRTDELINTGGAKVNPKTVEDALMAMPGIQDAAAFGVLGQSGVTRVWAAIVPAGELDIGALKQLCLERLKTLAPFAFIKMKTLPRNETGKILRSELTRIAIVKRAERIRAAKPPVVR